MRWPDWVPMEKRKPHYPLADIKSAFSDTDRLNRTFGSRQGADELGLNDGDVVAIIQALTISDFDKSMTSFADHKVWQDVYRSTVDDCAIYIKFTRDAQQAFLLISFKEA